MRVSEAIDRVIPLVTVVRQRQADRRRIVGALLSPLWGWCLAGDRFSVD